MEKTARKTAVLKVQEMMAVLEKYRFQRRSFFSPSCIFYILLLFPPHFSLLL
jgi:hypothetical protein